MNRVTVSAVELPLPEWSKTLESYARRVLAALGKDKWELSVLLCTDKIITGLNSKYRGKAESTDVLSFSLAAGEEFPAGCETGRGRYLPGDIVISLDTLRNNARCLDIDDDEELRRLLIHGILHLDGMNHQNNDDTEPMLQLQERILTQLSKQHIISRSKV
jgi:probable rRNA maturation factor